MIDILKVKNGIWVLEEDGQNVLLKDCLKFGISREERKLLFESLMLVASTLAEGGSLTPLVHQGLLKQLTRHPEALRENLWEVRSDARWGRILFVIRDINSIIVSAVDKGKGSLIQAIQRGIRRWEKFLKKTEK